jgi:flagellar basal-body rod modification protein FlgD
MNIQDARALGLLDTQGTTRNSSDKSSKNGVDGNTFMSLLVAQLKNQDPFQPQEGAAFVAQLAQFNSLEQLVSINDRLDQLINQRMTQTNTPGDQTKGQAKG